MENQTKTNNSLNVEKAKNQVMEYKIFCLYAGLSECSLNSLALFFKQRKAGA